MPGPNTTTILLVVFLPASPTNLRAFQVLLRAGCLEDRDGFTKVGLRLFFRAVFRCQQRQIVQGTPQLVACPQPFQN